jgi:glutathione S-transferase
MKLYDSPGACSLSPHIALLEAGVPFTAVKASTKTHLLDNGNDFYTINPKGYVPVLAAYQAQVAARPKVQEALLAEGLVKHAVAT